MHCAIIDVGLTARRGRHKLGIDISHLPLRQWSHVAKTSGAIGQLKKRLTAIIAIIAVELFNIAIIVELSWIFKCLRGTGQRMGESRNHKSIFFGYIVFFVLKIRFWLLANRDLSAHISLRHLGANCLPSTHFNQGAQFSRQTTIASRPTSSCTYILASILPRSTFNLRPKSTLTKRSIAHNNLSNFLSPKTAFPLISLTMFRYRRE